MVRLWLLMVCGLLLSMPAAAQTGKVKSDYLPAPGPIQTYKGKTLIGSTYPEADNEAFFAIVKQGLDMAEKLPAKYRDDIKLIQVILYDPPSPQRRATGIITNTPCVYTIGPDFMKTAPVVVYKDMKFTSALTFVEAFAGIGGMAQRHHKAMAVKRKMLELEGKGGKVSQEYVSLQRQLEAFVAHVDKSDPAQAQADNCDGMRLKFEIYKQFENDPRRRDAVARRISSLNCW